MKPFISIIIPSNSRERAEARVKEIKALFSLPYEVVLVDISGEKALAGLKRHTICAACSRGQAMEYGAAKAKGDVLLFLHDDTTLPPGADIAIQKTLEDPHIVGGGFTKRFRQKSPALRYLEWLSAQRARMRHIFYGDQAIFVLRDAFMQVNGFEGAPIFEDVILSKKLKRIGRLIQLPQTVMTDGQKIVDNLWKFTRINFRVKWMFWKGADLQQIFETYYERKG